MKTHQSMDEFGLTHDKLYKRDVAMPYWLQYGEKEFLQTLAHDLKGPGVAIDAYLKFIYEDPNVANLPINAANKMTVREICEVIFRSTDRLRDMLDIMWEYSENLKGED